MPSVIVRDTTNGWDLILRLADIPSPFPASCVKLMTLLLMWENHSSDWTTGTVTIGSGDFPSVTGTTLTTAGFQVGDIVTWQDLAYGLILPSGGDAAMAAARVIGDELYAAAGNTGTQGVTRFVEEMNTRAAELGMSNTVYADPFGGSKTFGPDVIRNRMSARDLSIVTVAAFASVTLRGIAGTTSHTASVGGPNARSIAWNNVDPFINGPQVSPAGIKDSTVIAGKTGLWSISQTNQYNMTTLWTAPGGQEIVITTLGSPSWFSAMLDQRGLMYMALAEFPYLLDAAGTDPNIADVRLLVGADSSLTDEGPDGRTLTASGAIDWTPGLVAESTGMIQLGDATDAVTTPDTPNLAVGSSDWTFETWYAAQRYPGFGAVPGSNVEYGFLFKAGVGVDREYGVNYFNGNFNLFASGDGSSWSVASFGLAAVDQAVFFNGAPRHLAIVRQSGTWYLFINGERVLNLAGSTVYDGSADIKLPPTGIAPIGRLDEVRMSAVARYTAAMVPILARKFPRT